MSIFWISKCFVLFEVICLSKLVTHLATKRCGDVVMTSLCTSQRRCSYVSNETPNDVPMERHQESGTSPRHLIGKSWRRLKRTYQRRFIGTSPQPFKQVLSETPNNFSLIRHQDVSVVRIHDVSLVRPYDVSCKSQMKHLLTLLWYVSTTSTSSVIVRITFSFG